MSESTHWPILAPIPTWRRLEVPVQEVELPPEPQLMESLRAVGYSLETAVADLVDNSVTAEASHVDVFFSAEGEPYLAILDDGHGMTTEELQTAMRLAGTNPLALRSSDDLGRFGLGLKTASLSQCRELTVITKRGDQLAAMRWDLDHLARTGRWTLLSLTLDEAACLPRYLELTSKASGTLVVWRRLDRLPDTTPTAFAQAFNEQMLGAKNHLALVFHRFISGTGGRQVTIAVNAARLRELDPFLVTHRATQRGPDESFAVAGERVEVQPFTLPYISKLTQAEREAALIAGRLRDSQGFYIYRARRLVIWGTWFRLVPKDDLGKLARVRVDIPNTLDHLWSLDIKKSAAVPPTEIRDQLRRLVDRIVFPSKRTQLFRGRRAAQNDKIVHTWELVEDRGSFRYELNRNHPILAALDERLDDGSRLLLTDLLRTIETSFPVEDAHNRMSSDVLHAPQRADDAELLAHAVDLWSVYQGLGHSADDFVAQMRSVEPFTTATHVEDLLRKASS